MEDEIVRNKIIQANRIGDNIKSIVADKESKIVISSLTKERVVGLYGFRKRRLVQEEEYKHIVVEIEKMLDSLKDYKKDIVLMIIVTSFHNYVIIFANETVDEFFGILDMTGLGNTGNYLTSI